MSPPYLVSGPEEISSFNILIINEALSTKIITIKLEHDGFAQNLECKLIACL